MIFDISFMLGVAADEPQVAARLGLQCSPVLAQGSEDASSGQLLNRGGGFSAGRAKVERATGSLRTLIPRGKRSTFQPIVANRPPI